MAFCATVFIINEPYRVYIFTSYRPLDLRAKFCQFGLVAECRRRKRRPVAAVCRYCFNKRLAGYVCPVAKPILARKGAAGINLYPFQTVLKLVLETGAAVALPVRARFQFKIYYISMYAVHIVVFNTRVHRVYAYCRSRKYACGQLRCAVAVRTVFYTVAVSVFHKR